MVFGVEALAAPVCNAARNCLYSAFCCNKISLIVDYIQ